MTESEREEDKDRAKKRKRWKFWDREKDEDWLKEVHPQAHVGEVKE